MTEGRTTESRMEEGRITEGGGQKAELQKKNDRR